MTTKGNAYYSSPVGDPAGRVLDVIRFHSLGAILDWLTGWLILLRSHVFSFSRPGTDGTGWFCDTRSQMKHWRVCVYYRFFFIVLPGGWGTALYKLYRHVQPHRVGFWSEKGYTLCPFWSVVGYGFRGNYWSVWTYLSFQFQMTKKERELCELEPDLKNFLFALQSK